MREFLTNYIKMIAENHDTDLTNDRLNEMVEDLMENEELWDTFDSYIYDLLDEEDD